MISDTDMLACTFRWRRLLGSIALVIVLAGCGAADTGSRWAGVVDTLPSGAMRVMNPADGLWTEDSAWRLVPALTIGNMEGPEATVFSTIAAITVDDEGRIYVLDRQANELRIFAPDGTHVRTVGRSGGGPGEYTNANGLVWLSSDTLVVVDQRGGRYTLLSRDGRYLRSQPRRLGSYSWVFSGGYYDGRIYERGLVGGPEDWQFALLSTPIAGTEAAAAAHIDTILLPKPSGPLWEEFSVQTERGGMSMSVPFAPEPVYHLDREGAVWHGRGSEFRIARSSLAGDTLREIVLDAAANPVTANELAEWEASEGMRQFRAMGGRLDMDRVPRVKPFFDGVYVDPDGYAWVSVPTAALRVEYALFDAEGRYRGRLAAEGLARDKFLLPIVRNGRLHIAGSDELDVPRVYVFDIER